MSYNYLPLDSTPTHFNQVKYLLDYDQDISVTFTAYESIEKCRRYLDNKMSGGEGLYYGINTGFGYLQDVKIDDSQIEQLQYNLLMSHACGMGDTVPTEIVKLMLALKVKSLSYGFSGVQNETVQRLIDLHNARTYPVVYTQGSLGASGDLSPLSHLCLPIIGMGKVWKDGRQIDTRLVEQELGWQPVHLKSKEGLALINGTQFMSAYGMWCLVKADRLIKWTDFIACISADAFNCNTQPFTEQIHRIRPHKGQIHTANRLRALLAQSDIAHAPGKAVQDPYSFRCIPQVHGASKDAFDHVQEVFLQEINSVTDNPNVFPDEDLILSGGNFHGQPLALALDYLGIAMSELANISERRTYQLISGQRGLPLFLVKDAGLNSGFMIPQYTAASMVSQNKQLCTPASVDSISSSNNQEDHVSMGANAATKCYHIVNNLEKVLAIELLSAAQALDYRRPMKSAPVLEDIIGAFRKQVSFNEKDRVLHEDMMAAVDFIRQTKIDDI
ncbi:MAG TPA: histidine ammonia-lyase [Phnomibacter sp.]|nr:histidine ammonia-lyase [Phnomibacter sp.]